MSVEGLARGGDGGRLDGPAGPGGNGGDASGTATGIAEGDGAVTVNHFARGGAGGRGILGRSGDGGSASSNAVGRNQGASPVSVSAEAQGERGGTSRVEGDQSGDGGDAQAHAEGESAAGPVDVIAIATASLGAGSPTGASSGSIPGSGGVGTAHATGTSRGGDVHVTAIQRSGSAGGSPNPGAPGVAGDSIAVDHVSGSSPTLLSLLQEAHAGSGSQMLAQGASGGDGGDATSVVDAVNPGGGDLVVEVIAASGPGGPVGGEAGRSYAAASGISNGDVSVSATQIQGGTGSSTPNVSIDSIMTDAVSGSTPGALTLHQHAQAGQGGPNTSAESSRGGDAVSSLSADNPGGGDIRIVSEATGGRGRDLFSRDHVAFGFDGDAGDGGTARASAVVDHPGAQDVSVSAIARGGAGARVFDDVVGSQDSGDGGEALLGIVYGRSAGGGDVSVSGRAEGGNGGRAKEDASALPGAGAPAILVDAVDGDTSGTLELSQTAIAGHVGLTLLGVSPGAANAQSSLTKSTSSSSLQVATEARAGNASWRNAPTGTAHPAGDSLAEAHAANDSGDAAVRALSVGGRGGTGNGGAAGGRGGNARLDVSATTTGDQQAIRVGDLSAALSGATGGLGGSATSGGQPAAGAPAKGGGAISTSTGNALGDSSVWVLDRATGAPGGSLSGVFAGRPGDGGDGWSTAWGGNVGSSPVEVISEAHGGRAGLRSDVGPGASGGLASANATGFSAGSATVRATASSFGGLETLSGLTPVAFGTSGGDATSDASATSAGEALADAHAVGGYSESTGRSGVGLARATATGAFGMASASAEALMRDGRDVLEVRTGASAPVAAGTSSATAGASTGGAFPFTPSADVDAYSVATTFSRGAGNRFRGEGAFALSPDHPPNGDDLSADLSITLRPFDLDLFGEEMAIVFHDLSILDGFEALHFEVLRQGSVVWDEVFTEAAPALAFLSSGPLLLADFGTAPFSAEETFDFSFSLTAGTAGGGIEGLYSILLVPEPSTGVLIGVALLWARRASTRRTGASRDPAARRESRGGRSRTGPGRAAARSCPAARRRRTR